MGMPVNSYTIFRLLANKPKSSEEYSMLHRALEPFNLFAFVLHDPKEHKDFHRHFAQWFERLDFSTGKKLLFFALIAPEGEWNSLAGNRTYYRNISSWEAKQLAMGDSAPRTTEPGLSAAAIALSLNIPSEKLPCVVITNDFNKGSFFWIPTSEELIRDQLQELGYIAERMEREKSFKPLEDIHRQLKLRFPELVHEHNLLNLEDSLAEALYDVLSFIVIGDQKSDYLSYDAALKQAKKSISHLYQKLQQSRYQGKEPSDLFERLSLVILQYLSLINKSSDIPAILSLKSEYLEQDSRLILKTAYKVYDLFHHPPSSEIFGIYAEEYDWSPCLIGFSKVFEKEINSSVVQWLRQEKGIEMPRYYLKLKPGHIAKLVKVDLNRSYDNEWMAPGVGQSEKVFESYSALNLPQGWDQEQASFLLKKWGTIRESRNSAAHDRVIEETELNCMLDAMRDLAQKEYFTLLYHLKSLLRV